MMQNPHHESTWCAADTKIWPRHFWRRNNTFDHLDLLDRLRSNVTETFYHSGHMIYHDPASRKQLKANVSAFISAAA